MTGPRITEAPRKSYPSDNQDGDQREKPYRFWRDVGPPCAEPDFKAPAKVKSPEETMSAAFTAMGFDYGGKVKFDAG